MSVLPVGTGSFNSFAWTSPDLVAHELLNVLNASAHGLTVAGAHKAHTVIGNIQQAAAHPAQAAYICSLDAPHKLLMLANNLQGHYFRGPSHQVAMYGDLLVQTLACLNCLITHSGDSSSAVANEQRHASVLADMCVDAFSPTHMINLTTPGANTRPAKPPHNRQLPQPALVSNVIGAAVAGGIMLHPSDSINTQMTVVAEYIMAQQACSPNHPCAPEALQLLSHLASHEAWLPAVRRRLPLSACISLVNSHMSHVLEKQRQVLASPNVPGLNAMSTLAIQQAARGSTMLMHAVEVMVQLVKPPSLYSALEVEQCLQLITCLLYTLPTLPSAQATSLALPALSALHHLCIAHCRECDLGTASSVPWPAGVQEPASMRRPPVYGLGSPSKVSPARQDTTDRLLRSDCRSPEKQLWAAHTPGSPARPSSPGSSNYLPASRGPPLSPRRAALGASFAALCTPLASLVLAVHARLSSAGCQGAGALAVNAGPGLQGVGQAGGQATGPGNGPWTAASAAQLGWKLAPASAHQAAITAMVSLTTLAQESRYQEPLVTTPGLLSQLASCACSWDGALLHAFSRMVESVACKCPAAYYDRLFRNSGTVAPLLRALRQGITDSPDPAENDAAALAAAAAGRTLTELTRRSSGCAQQILDAGAAGMLLDLAAHLAATAQVQTNTSTSDSYDGRLLPLHSLAVTLHTLLQTLRASTTVRGGAAGTPEPARLSEPVRLSVPAAKMEATVAAPIGNDSSNSPASPRVRATCAQVVQQSLMGPPAAVAYTRSHAPAAGLVPPPPGQVSVSVLALTQQLLHGPGPVPRANPASPTGGGNHGAHHGSPASVARQSSSPPTGVDTPGARTPNRNTTSQPTSASSSKHPSEAGLGHESAALLRSAATASVPGAAAVNGGDQHTPHNLVQGPLLPVAPPASGLLSMSRAGSDMVDVSFSGREGSEESLGLAQEGAGWDGVLHKPGAGMARLASRGAGATPLDGSNTSGTVAVADPAAEGPMSDDDASVGDITTPSKPTTRLDTIAAGAPQTPAALSSVEYGLRRTHIAAASAASAALAALWKGGKSAPGSNSSDSGPSSNNSKLVFRAVPAAVCTSPSLLKSVEGLLDGVSGTPVAAVAAVVGGAGPEHTPMTGLAGTPQPAALTTLADGSGMMFESVVVIDGQAMRVRSIIKQTETTAADGTRSMLYSFDDQVSPGLSADAVEGKHALNPQQMPAENPVSCSRPPLPMASDHVPAATPVFQATGLASQLSPTRGSGVSSSKIDRSGLAQLRGLAGHYLAQA